VKDFAEFLGDEAEHNLLIFGDNESRRHTRNLALTLGVDLDPAVSISTIMAIDHLSDNINHD